jgi:phytoene dehydrogenase-like protein
VVSTFGLLGLQSCERVQPRFRGPAARALFAGSAAHSFLPLSAPASASFGIVLAAAGHAVDWPCAAGGWAATTVLRRRFNREPPADLVV